jgi:hypothetical protein
MVETLAQTGSKGHVVKPYIGSTVSSIAKSVLLPNNVPYGQ